MVIDLLNAIAARLAGFDEFSDADISVAINPRFAQTPEGKLSVVVSPIACQLERDARGYMKETTTVQVSIHKYFADVFNENDPYELLSLAPMVETALIMQDYSFPDATYRWESSYSGGEPFNDTRRETIGGMFDIDAADNAYTLQAPVLIQFVRFLKVETP